MSQPTQILRSTGSTPPLSLLAGQLAYCEGSGVMYVGTIGGTVVPVAAKLATVTHSAGETLADSDAGKIAEMDGGTLTLDASVLTSGNVGFVRQTGTTAVTVSPATGTTIYPTGARTTAGQGCMLVWQVSSSTLAYVNGEVAS